MAYFARIENNIVTSVLAVPNEEEHRGQDFLANDLGLGGTWIQTSYNAKFRKHYAGLGYTYDETRDAFIPPQCHDQATLEESTCLWTCDNEAHAQVI
jgi:hypothetical protein